LSVYTIPDLLAEATQFEQTPGWPILIAGTLSAHSHKGDDAFNEHELLRLAELEDEPEQMFSPDIYTVRLHT